MTGKKTSAPPWVTTPLPRSTRRPQLRCPACGSTFTPPAEICPDCRVDLRLGRRKRQFLPDWLQLPPEIMRPLKTATIIGLALAFGGAAVSGVHGYLNRPPAPPAAVPRAPDSFQRLAREYPVLLRPYVIMYKTRAAVAEQRDNLTYRQHFMEELAKSVNADANDDATEIIVMSRRLTPGQRLKMLKELMSLNALPEEAQVADQELMRQMSPAGIHRELKQLDENTSTR